MADSTPPDEFGIPLLEVKGFHAIQADFLKFPYGVEEKSRCLNCKCIPREIYPLLCPNHGLCINCKDYCNDYYCEKCDINTNHEQLKNIRPSSNYTGLTQLVLCHRCEKQMLLGRLEEHYLHEHTNQARMEESNFQAKTDAKHLIECQKYTRMYPDCDSTVLTQELGYHQTTEPPKKFSCCNGCFRQIALEELYEHRYACPKIVKTCPKCNAHVSNEDLKNHWAVECQKRVIYCGMCTNAIPFDQQVEHEKECPKWQITCVDCGLKVQRMDYSRHQSWCSERWVLCKLCNILYRYSEYGSHLEECSKAAARSAIHEYDVPSEGFQCNLTPQTKVQPVFGNTSYTQARLEEKHEQGQTRSEVEKECSRCSESILIKEFEAHWSTACKKRPVHCEFCNCHMRFDELGGHITECEEWEIICPSCKCHIKRKDKSKHFSEACPEREVRCNLCGVSYTYSQKMKHEMECEEYPLKCPDCNRSVIRKNMNKHLLDTCPHREVYCELCGSKRLYSEMEKHSSECPKARKECPDCAVHVVNEDLDKHLKEQCQKRVRCCQACYSPMAFDELSEHDKVCEDKRVACEKCRHMVPRKEMAKHLKESCSKRVHSYEVRKEECTYSDKTACYQQYVKKTYLCTYCDVELKASDDREEHYQTCDRVLVECPFKGYGCDKKGPRKEISEHVNNPHNALLNQVIINLQERLAKIEKPLDKFVEELRRRKSSK